MAPELIEDFSRASAASDIFALGGVILYAATGHAPYHGDTLVEVITRLKTEAPDISELPDSLFVVVSGCLERDPARRPRSADLLAELASQLEAGP
jgi:serine/threonine protein kinase